MVSLDRLSKQPAYDHFAGATLVPSLVQLGSQFDQLGGDVQGRLQRLWAGESEKVDASLMELFTAARCAGLGREVEFISETTQKSPDLRCHDPFPLVIDASGKRHFPNTNAPRNGSCAISSYACARRPADAVFVVGSAWYWRLRLRP